VGDHFPARRSAPISTTGSRVFISGRRDRGNQITPEALVFFDVAVLLRTAGISAELESV
jgi:hypothetical protein